LSQPKQVTLTDLKEWIRKETIPTLEPLKSKGASILKEVQFRLDDAIESSKKIVEKSEDETKKSNPKTHRFARNANKFANTLLETLKDVKVPEHVSYQNLQTFGSNLEKIVTTMLQLRAEAYPYITPYFIFDRRRLDVSIKRLADINQDLHNFTTTKYSKAKTIEDTSTTVDRLLETIKHSYETQSENQELQQKLDSLKLELAVIEQEITHVQSRAELAELTNAEDRIKDLRENVKHNMRYLQKPFFKLQSLARSGNVAIPVDEAKKLGEYLSDPFEALATEQDGQPLLKDILRKVSEAMNQGKLKLKSTRIRKAHEQIDNVLNKASLDSLYKNCAVARSYRKELLMFDATLDYQNKLMQLQDRLKNLQKENELTTTRIKALETEHKRLLEKIGNERKELEKTLMQLTSKNIQVVLS
jgi:hypothetical protein